MEREDATMLGRFGRAWATVASRLHVRSALNPMLWMCVIISLPMFLLAFWCSQPTLAAGFFVMGALPVFVDLWGFVRFATNAPHLLQSEEYQIKHEALRIIMEQKGRRSGVDVAALEAIAKPSSLPPPGGTK